MRCFCEVHQKKNMLHASWRGSLESMHDSLIQKVLRRTCRVIDRINFWLGRGVAWLTLLVVLVVFGNVVMRYFFNTSFVFMQELEWHIFSAVFLLGGGYTLLKDGHVRVDIIYQRLSPRGRAWVNLFGVLLFLLPGCYLVIASSLSFVISSYSMMEGSPDPGGIPYRFILKGLIPAAFVLLVFQGVSLAFKSVLVLTGAESGQELPAAERQEWK